MSTLPGGRLDRTESKRRSAEFHHDGATHWLGGWGDRFTFARYARRVRASHRGHYGMYRPVPTKGKKR